MLWYRRPIVWHASMTGSWIGLLVLKSIALAKASFVEAGPSPVSYMTEVFTRAIRRENVKWQNPNLPWWRGV